MQRGAQVLRGALVGKRCSMTGFTQVMEKSGKIICPQGQGIFEFDIRSGKSQGILIDTLPNRHSTYGYGSLLKIAVNKDRKNLIEHPILYSEVFIYIHITAYCIHIFYKIQVVSNLDRRLKGVYVPCYQCYIRAENSLWFPSVFIQCNLTFIIKQYGGSDKNQINSQVFLSKRRKLKQST